MVVLVTMELVYVQLALPGEHVKFQVRNPLHQHSELKVHQVMHQVMNTS